MNAQPERQPHTIRFEVDGEPVETTGKKLTPIQIMELADVDPADHYLVEIKGRNQKAYQDEPDKPITVHDGDRFITVATGPTPVS